MMSYVNILHTFSVRRKKSARFSGCNIFSVYSILTLYFTQFLRLFQQVVKILFSQLIFVWYIYLILFQTCSRTIVDLK